MEGFPVQAHLQGAVPLPVSIHPIIYGLQTNPDTTSTGVSSPTYLPDGGETNVAIIGPHHLIIESHSLEALACQKYVTYFRDSHDNICRWDDLL